MKIVVMCGSYMPNYSAVGICAKNIVDEFLRMGHEVYVIAERTAAPITEEHKETIRHISTPIFDLHFSKNKYVKLTYRVIRFLGAIFSRQNIKKDIVKAYQKELEAIQQESPIDLVIPFCFPFESLIATRKFSLENDGIKYVPYIFDNLVINDSYNRLKINRIIKRKRHSGLLKNIVTDSHKSMIMHSQRAFFEKNLSDLTQKINFCEHPLLIKPIRKQSRSNEVFYAGAFLKGYVPSVDLAKIIKEILPKTQNKYEFCVMGNDTESIVMLSKSYPERIINNGRVPYSVVEDKMSSAGFLLSVAEVNGVQISSKIFSYISTGKPIIHFYYKQNDINKKILERYPSACLIDILHPDIDLLIRFLSSSHPVLDFETVAEIFCDASPKYICNLILENI